MKQCEETNIGNAIYTYTAKSPANQSFGAWKPAPPPEITKTFEHQGQRHSFRSPVRSQVSRLIA